VGGPVLVTAGGIVGRIRDQAVFVHVLVRVLITLVVVAGTAWLTHHARYRIGEPAAN
jgi:hypothetical protein